VLTVKQVAERLNVSLSTVYGLVSHGKLRARRIGTGRGAIRVSEDALQQYLDASVSEATHAASTAAPTNRPQRGRPFKHLDADRLRAAWRKQGVCVDPQDARNAQSSG
jgi:excisionase family DNA binding protein